MEEHGVSNYLCLGLKPVRPAAGVMGTQFPIPLLQGGKTWVSPDCTQSCICTMGSLQCSPFSCPSGSHCQFHDQDTAICKPDSKAQPRGHRPPHHGARCLSVLSPQVKTILGAVQVGDRRSTPHNLHLGQEGARASLGSSGGG